MAEGWSSAHGKGLPGQRPRPDDPHGPDPARMVARPAPLMVRNADEFTPAEIAGRLNIPESTIYCWIYKQRLPARRAEAAERSLWLVRLADVQRLLRQRGPAVACHRGNHHDQHRHQDNTPAFKPAWKRHHEQGTERPMPSCQNGLISEPLRPRKM